MSLLALVDFQTEPVESIIDYPAEGINWDCPSKENDNLMHPQDISEGKQVKEVIFSVRRSAEGKGRGNNPALLSNPHTQALFGEVTVSL